MIEALYIHIPFCKSRCSYCDFSTSACDDEARMSAYVEALCLQLRRSAKAGLLGGVKTVYIGGGTPTHLGKRLLNSLLYMISVSVNLENVVEFTCEANPESIDQRLVADLYSLGVDRFSIGVQSFDDDVLRGYGRIHDVEAVEKAVLAAQTRTESVSIDLICGGPGQSMDSWVESLQAAVFYDVAHVSIYPLQLEKGTPLERRVSCGEALVADEDMQADMMIRADEALQDAGLYRYEVASYAKPGFESKHNLAYWSGKEYLGLGAGASSMLSIKTFEQTVEARLFDVPGLEDGLSCEASPAGNSLCASTTQLEQAESDPGRIRIASSPDDVAFSSSLGRPFVEIEVLNAYEAAVEDLMLGMRRSIGVPCEQVRAVEGAPAVFVRLEQLGLLAERDGRFIPTERGWLFGNEVYGAIWELAG